MRMFQKIKKPSLRTSLNIILVIQSSVFIYREIETEQKFKTQAIELDNIKTLAQSAISTGIEAQDTADQAKTNAEEAQGTADEAQSASIQAQYSADDAQDQTEQNSFEVAEAQDTADQAKDEAETAQLTVGVY